MLTLVEYAVGADLELKTHADDADVTLNVCLGHKGFTGGDVFFHGTQMSSVQRLPKSMSQFVRDSTEFDVAHEVGRAVLHRGGHVHGARQLESGARVNLIVWCKATEAYR